MSFWTGFAQAVKDSDDRKFKKELLGEERKHAREDFLFKTGEQRKTALLSTLAKGGVGGGSRSGGSKSSPISIEALSKQFPGLSKEKLAQLAPYPEAIAQVHSKLMKTQKEVLDAGGTWDPQMGNSMITGVAKAYEEDPEMKAQKVQSILNMYGVKADEPIYDGAEKTWGDVAEESVKTAPQGTVIYDQASGPALMKPEEKATFRKNIENDLKGFLEKKLSDNRRTIGELSNTGPRGTSQPVPESLKQDNAELQKLLDEIDQGYLDNALSSPYGTERYMQYAENDQRLTDFNVLPGFVPSFNTPEDVQKYFDKGLLKKGQTIRVGGKTVRID